MYMILIQPMELVKSCAWFVDETPKKNSTGLTNC